MSVPHILKATPPSLGTRCAQAAGIGPGLLFAGAIAVAAYYLEPMTTRATLAAFGRPVTITAPVLGLVLGIALHPVAAWPLFAPGTTFSVNRVLRWAIALFGLKIAAGDIVGLGMGTVAMVVVTMALTLVSGVLFARLFGRGDLYGALAGGATAVCGASAALATASVLPDYQGREADTAFVAMTVNLLATAAMLAYPPICNALGFDDRTTGIFFGATIHDVAQVVGAGYAVSDMAGNAATVVKLFRVLMLLPVVTGVGWWFAARGGDSHRAKVPVPVFALMFLAFVAINSFGLLPSPLKATLVEASRWGLLIAIAALGLNTSLQSIFRVGPRHILVVLGSTLVVFLAPLVWILASR